MRFSVREATPADRPEQLQLVNELMPTCDPERRLARYLALLRDVVNDFVILMGEARNERLSLVRKSWPALPPD